MGDFKTITCRCCGTEYEDGDVCPKCDEEWKKNMHCDHCGGEFSRHESRGNADDDYQRFSITDELGTWDDWDHNGYHGHFCSLKCMRDWLNKKLDG